MADGQKRSSVNLEAIRKAISRLHLRDVSLRSCKVDLADEYIPKLGSQDLEVQLKWGPRAAKEMLWKVEQTNAVDKVFLVEMSTAIRFVDLKEDSNKKTAAEILPQATYEATFLAEYKVDGDAEVPADAFEEFAKHNVIYHVWPFWRELILNMCGRTHVPSFTLPMFAFNLDPTKTNVIEAQPVPRISTEK